MDCKMCESYGRPGWIVNAQQWIRCFDCNPTTPKPAAPDYADPRRHVARLVTEQEAKHEQYVRERNARKLAEAGLSPAAGDHALDGYRDDELAPDGEPY